MTSVKVHQHLLEILLGYGNMIFTLAAIDNSEPDEIDSDASVPYEEVDTDTVHGGAVNFVLSTTHLEIVMHELFDLDMALTMPDENSTTELNNRQPDSQSTTAAQCLIDEMPTVVRGGGECTVCMEGFRLGVTVKQVHCGHIFHANCIFQWLCLHNSCPLCRTKVVL
ncbi:hypothetical protein BUALT_Bualt16G0062100 [Buddleja alternifolia]|uniref:RING-type domain-containing protein n=1 Tax=Buddleja alternifolia TaxID=168488 RepID=A0AAV6WA56_9LAMI|nr:hypothetical protein BUALT_Bualt16G0062100 [Buddleja alternifolia]